jgi:hypothetical protein
MNVRTHVRRGSAVLAAAGLAAVALLLPAGPAAAQAGTDHLGANEILDHGQSLFASSNTLTMQDDGNLVEYADQHIAIWATGTHVGGSILKMQDDGNLVVIAPGNVAQWGSGSRTRGSVTVLQTDGNLVIEVPGTPPVWANNKYAQAYAAGLFRQHGWGPDQWGCLDQLWQHESGWNALARNPSSGAYGIPQSLPANKMAVEGSDWQTSAFTQVRWGENDYIAPRYVSPCAAWSFWQSHGWY